MVSALAIAVPHPYISSCFPDANSISWSSANAHGSLFVLLCLLRHKQSPARCRLTSTSLSGQARIGFVFMRRRLAPAGPGGRRTRRRQRAFHSP